MRDGQCVGDSVWVTVGVMRWAAMPVDHGLFPRPQTTIRLQTDPNYCL